MSTTQSPSRNRTATVAGVFFLLTEVSAIAALASYQPVLNQTDYLRGGGADNRVLLGVLCELVLIAAIVGTAVTLYPVVKHWGPGIALGYVAGRIVEGVIIAVGIVSLMAAVTLRQDGPAAGVDDGSFTAVGQTLVALHDATFLFGPGFVIGINSALLAYLMYRSELVPRWIAKLGLIGGPLILLTSIGAMFDLYSDSVHTTTALPVFAWEVSIAIYMITKGFKTTKAPGEGEFKGSSQHRLNF